MPSPHRKMPARLFTDALPGKPASDAIRHIQLVTNRRAEFRLRPDGAVVILSIGDDGHLLESRQMVLESVGYGVRSVSSFGIVEDQEVRRFDLTVICHSVGEERAAAVAVSLRQTNPAIRVLRLATQDGKPRDCFDQLLIPASPGALLAAIHQLLMGKITSTGLD